MKISRSRRMFLQGSGGLMLAAPTLTSLLPRRAEAHTQVHLPVRYVQWVTNHGQQSNLWWPKINMKGEPEVQVNGTPVPGVKAKLLSELQDMNKMSTMLGAANGFDDAVRAKMTILGGLDVLTEKKFHNSCSSTCATSPSQENHKPDKFPYSVDAVMEKSTEVYPTPSKVTALRMTPGVNWSYKWGSYSWHGQNLPAKDKSSVILGEDFAGVSTKPTTTLDPAVTQRIKLTNRVIEDYRSTSKNTRLSTTDRNILSTYMDLMADIERRLDVKPAACEVPNLVNEAGNFDLLHDNFTDLTVAALLCGITRIAAYHCFQSSPTYYDEESHHGWAHMSVESTNTKPHVDMMTWRTKQLAKLVTKMNAITEGNGKTLLDNSLVYQANELSNPGHGAQHLENMPLCTFGSAGGHLRTGEYIYFSSRPVNNLLVTFFNVMGMAPADYERGSVGFGTYNGGVNMSRYTAYLSDSEKRKPLPYYYLG